MTMRPILLISIVCLLCLSACHYKKMGFYDREEYKLYREYPSKSCGLVELCFNEDEAYLWKRDSLGERGDRKKLWEEYEAYFLKGEFNGISWDCMYELLGKASEIDSLFSPQDSTFTYKVYKSQTSSINLNLRYNLAMDKIVGTQADYFYDEAPVPTPACPDAYYSKTDSMLARKYLMDFPKTRRRSEIVRYTEVQGDLKGLPINCYLCYNGAPDFFWMGTYIGIYGKEEKFTAKYKYSGGSTFELTLSPDSARILNTEYERVYHDR